MTARKLALPDRLRGGEPPVADPTPPPVEAAAVAPAAADPTPPPTAESAPASMETISDDELAQAVAVVIAEGKATKAGLQKALKISAGRATALLAEMEAKGAIGPAPRAGKSREILVSTWPPEVEPVEPIPSPEEPTPTEPEPAEAPPGPPPPETPPTASEEEPISPSTPEAPEDGKNFLRRAYERFISKFKGEVQPEDEKAYKASWGDVAKNAATGFLSVTASYTGVKLLADLPQWLYQKYWTNPAERERLRAAFASKDTETGVEHTTAIDQRKARLEQAINESKFLSTEKRAELLAKLQTSVEGYKTAEETAREHRNQEIAKLLDQAIETRVKNTQVLKEALNSALMVTGLSAMRGVAYGAVAVYERHQEVMASPERRMQYWKEMTYRGFTETAHNLLGGKADTWTGKGMNFVKGATNILRAAGFADLAIAEWTSEGRSVSSIIETSLKAFEEKGLATATWENIKAPWERLGHLGEYAKSTVTGSEPADGGTVETPGGAGTVGGAPDSAEAAAAAATTGATGVAAAEGTPHVEVPEATIETGVVKKGDGILKILERQGIEAKSAIEAAREAGIVRAAGDTRLTTEAIGRLSVFAEAKPEGGIEIKFFDAETDKVITLAEAREAGFTYESGTVPGEIPTDKEIAEYVPEPVEKTEIFSNSDAPNYLLGDTFIIWNGESGNLHSIDVGNGDALRRMNEAIQELDRLGYGDSPEARFIWQQMQILLVSEGADPSPTGLPPAEAAEHGVEEVRAQDAAESIEAGTDDEPLRKFKGEAGKLKFVYDKETGAVKDAFMPAYTPRPQDIEDSLSEWGLTTKVVKAHFFEGASRTHIDGTAIDTSHSGHYPGDDRSGFPIQSPENDYRQFTRDAERLSRQESLLLEMEEMGYARTPEYARVKMETDTLEKYVAGTMKRQFNIQERLI